VLYGLLPLLNGWTFKPYDIDIWKLAKEPITVRKGTTYFLSEAKKPGFLVAAAVVVDSKQAQITIEYYDSYGRIQRMTARPYGLYYSGYLQPNPIGPWLARYDETENVYAIMISPSHPIPFRADDNKRYRAYLTATEEDTNLLGFQEAIILIDDEEAFMESLRRVWYPIEKILKQFLRGGK